jgi:hypothetical protein
VGAFLGQPRGTGPADTVRSTGDDHRSAGESPKFSLPHSSSLPPARIKGFARRPRFGLSGRARPWASTTCVGRMPTRL